MSHSPSGQNEHCPFSHLTVAAEPSDFVTCTMPLSPDSILSRTAPKPPPIVESVAFVASVAFESTSFYLASTLMGNVQVGVADWVSVEPAESAAW